MKDIARMALQKDMEIAKDIISGMGEIIVKANTKVTDQIIQKLARYNIMVVPIMEDVDYAVTYFEKIRLSEGFRRFEKVYREGMDQYKNLIKVFLDGTISLPMDALMEIYHMINDSVDVHNKTLDYLYNLLPNEEDLTYAHCLNSALIAGVFGPWLGFRKEENDLLIKCGFLYDIGKFKLPNELIWKPSRLTEIEFTQMKTHTILGFQLLQGQKVPETVLKATLSHHERFDGSGYPSRLHDLQIDYYARIIAIIDSYEAMTSLRTWRESKHPFQVIDIFLGDAFKYDMDILRQILFNVANHLIGQKVLLSNDVKAEVVLINQANMARPLLREDNGTFIDLMSRTDLKIMGIY
ncbi:MAG: HD domain-containing protein [Lachnospiraceae bacterium]|nr:HD domain-containing protein [Lachnospiraceae bacterium]